MRFLIALLATVATVAIADDDPHDQSGVPLEVDTTDPSLTKILLLAGSPSSKPGGHEYFAGCALLMDWLRQTPGVFPVMARDGWPRNERIFQNARAVVFYMDGSAKIPFLEEARWQRIRELEQRGVGLVFLHQMVDFPEDRRTEAGSWLGGVFANGLGGRGHWESTFDQFPNHPVANGLQPFSINDGWLYGMEWVESRDRLTPILTTVPPDSSRTSAASRQRAGRAETIAWTFERTNGGRSFSFTGADAHANWGVESVRRVTINGILWAAGITVPLEGAPVRMAPGDLNRNLDDKRRPTAGRKPARNPNVKYIAPAALPGIGLDDIDAEITGSWTGSSAAGPTIIGVNYLHDGGKNKGKASITFSPDVLAPGEYEILLFAPPQGNRAKDVPVTIQIEGTPAMVIRIDQSRVETRGVHSLGRHRLPGGRGTRITVSNAGTKGVVVVDGLQLLP
jgi:hypothetical protein